jgi:hypothetical protein
LLDQPSILKTAAILRENLVRDGLLSRSSRAVQAIVFDKNAATNWRVSWHQDVMFPFAAPTHSPEFDLPSRKDGVHYARPPRWVLEELVVGRLHFDDCDHSNGPLQVSPASHVDGILPSTRILTQVGRRTEVICSMASGELRLMKPLVPSCVIERDPAEAPEGASYRILWRRSNRGDLASKCMKKPRSGERGWERESSKRTKDDSSYTNSLIKIGYF